MNTERYEYVLLTIDKLGVVSVKQLHDILKIGSYRYTCKIVSQLEKYLHVDRSKHKMVYLNKEGREFIGSDKEIKKSNLFEHMLLTNEVFIYYDCPQNWKKEYIIEITESRPNLNFIKVKGINVSNKTKIVSDAYFKRNGYSYFIEIDNVRKMRDNKMKIQKYLDMWPEVKKQFQNPILCIFTHSDKRKKMFLDWTKNIPNEIKVFSEL